MTRRARAHPEPRAAPRRPRHAARARVGTPETVLALGTLVGRAVALGLGPGRHRPRHCAPVRLRISPVFACLSALSLVVAGAALGSLSTGGAQAATPPVAGTSQGEGQSVSIMNPSANSLATSQSVVPLPAATAPPAPAPPSLESQPALQAHEVFGFAPYWALPISSGFDVKGLTTLDYFSVDVAGDGAVQESGPGWVGYQSQALAELVTRAHEAGDRVVLTASCFGQSALDQMASDPSTGPRLATALVALVAAKNLDGVNIDFEGRGSKDQAGLDTLMAAVSSAMHQANPHWQVTMDTYASSAGDPSGFYDIRGLAPSVDAFFVMAYDMNDRSTPSPTAPLTGTGFTDLDAVQQYAAAVPPSKVILGVPYYGYDWPTAGPGLGDPATGPPTPMSYSQIAATGGHVYWDPTTQTPWTSYQVGSQWHQTFFDNPTSLALKAQLADTYHVAGVGIWAMGMEGSDPAMQAALQGSAPPVKAPAPGPGATLATTTTTTTAAAAARRLLLLGHLERRHGDAQPRRPRVAGRRAGAPGFGTADRLHHRRSDADVPGVGAGLAGHGAVGRPRPLRRHDHPAGRLHGRSVGVHRVPATPGGQRAVPDDDDLDHGARTDDDHGADLHHHDLTGVAVSAVPHHTTRVSWPSQ